MKLPQCTLLIKGFPMVPIPQLMFPWFGKSQCNIYKANKPNKLLFLIDISSKVVTFEVFLLFIVIVEMEK
jgi:hypothetical protein